MEFDRDSREWRMFAETLSNESSKRYATAIESFLEWSIRNNDAISSYRELAHISKKRITAIMQDYLHENQKQ